MRVPTNQSTDGFLASLSRLRAAEARAARAASSGKRIHQASDDPTGAARAASLRRGLEALRSTAAAITIGRGATGAVDGSIASMEEDIERAFQLGSQAATTLVSPAQRSVLAASIRDMASSLLAEGNRSHQGYGLYGGGETQQPAFTLAGDGSFVYQGDQVVRHVSVGSERIGLNIPGDRILAGPVNAGRVLEDLALAVDSGDVDAMATALQGVEALRRQVVSVRSEVGLSMARLEQAETELMLRSEHLTTSLSDVEDADLVEVATELTRVGQAIEASLGSYNMTNQVNLFDFLT